MKKIFVLALLASSMYLTSCGGKKEEAKQEETTVAPVDSSMFNNEAIQEGAEKIDEKNK